MDSRQWMYSLGWLVVLTVAAPGPVRAAESLAQVHTPLGDLLVVLRDTDKPATVANFKQYITSGRFRDSFVQRWEPGFVIQGGGFFVTNRASANPQITYVPTFGTITNEYSVGRVFSNAYGTIAMARVSGQTNSASSQWFLNLADNVSLNAVDGGFTVFGHVAAGTNVLNRFNNTSVSNGIYRANLGGALTTLPVLSSAPTYGDLVYTDFSLPAWPQAQIAVGAEGTRTLTWNSLSNFVNQVEFSPAFPPVWQNLVSTNGTGQMMQVTDARPGIGRGIYRIRIE